MTQRIRGCRARTTSSATAVLLIATMILSVALTFLPGVIVPIARGDKAVTVDTTLQLLFNNKVKVKCDFDLIPNPKQKAQYSLSSDCKFTNLDANTAYNFFYCNMLDVKNKTKRAWNATGEIILGGKSFVLELKAGTPPTLQCTDKTAVLGPKGIFSQWHFGCQQISLAAGQKEKLYTSKSPDNVFYTLPLAAKGKVKASDFLVRYSDVVDISKLPANTMIDPKGTCNLGPPALDGQSNFLVPCFAKYNTDHPGLNCGLITARGDCRGDPNDPVCAYWVVDQTDLTDPYVSYGTTTQHVFDDDLPCAPSSFPYTIPGLPQCPIRSSVQPTTVDLNLYNWYTMASSTSASFAAFLNFTTQGDMTGLVLNTNPSQGSPTSMTFSIPGGVEFYGNLTVCASSCMAPSAPEGRSLNVTVDVFNNTIPTAPQLMFSQGMSFVQDSVPPVIGSITTAFDSTNSLIVNVGAADATTSPIATTLWFSTNAGTSWNSTELQSTTDVLQQATSRVFSGGAGPFLGGTMITYFLAVEDAVGNTAYSGVGQVTAPIPRVGAEPVPANKQAILASLAFASLVVVTVALASIYLKRQRSTRLTKMIQLDHFLGRTSACSSYCRFSLIE